MSSVNRKPSALAAAAARAAGSGISGIRFRVAHLGRNGIGDQLTLDAQFPDNFAPERLVREALSFEVAGNCFELRTWTPQASVATDPGVQAAIVERNASNGERGPWHGEGHSRDGFLYGGSGSLNPNFLYDSVKNVEVLLTVGDDAWNPSFRDSLMTGMTLENLARAAAEIADAPIMFLQSPVAPFHDRPPRRFRQDGSGEEPRRSQGSAIRLSMGLEEGRSKERLAFVEYICSFANENGLGLQFADRRYGRVRGEWWSVIEFDRDIFVQRSAELFPWADVTPPSTARMITFVGPARVGSSLAILRDLAARHVGVLAISVSGLQDLAFVNVLVPVAPARYTSAPTDGTSTDLLVGLGSIASECGLTPRRRVKRRLVSELTAAMDYQVLNSGPVTLTVPPVDTIEYPIWMSWELPEGLSEACDPTFLVLSQLNSRSDVVQAAGLDYYRSRVIPSGRTRGRAKLSVHLVGLREDRIVPELLGDLCVRGQTEAVGALLKAGVPQPEIRLRVAWRERWLGRWATVL